jgi:hypothetical protein
MDQLYVQPAGLVILAVLPVEFAQTTAAPEIIGAGGVELADTATESKHAALFSPVPPVWPSSQIVMELPVAVTVPLKGTQVLLVVVWAGFRLIAVAQLVEALGLHFTVQVAEAEFVLIQPEMV